MDAMLKALVEQGGYAVLAAVALILVSKVWELRCKDKDEMAVELKVRNDRLLTITEKLAEALGKNSEVIDRNTDMLEQNTTVVQNNTKAFEHLQALLQKVNGK